MHIDGACLCGGVSYTAAVDPARVIICHCTDCQTVSGAPYRVNAPVLAENFAVRGEPAIYPKRGGSGETVDTAFCPTCGTALWSAKGASPPFFWLRMGAVKQRAALPPKSQGFCASALPWAFDLSGVRRLPEAQPRP